MRGNLLLQGLRALVRDDALILAGLVRLRAVGGMAPQHRARRRQTGRGRRVHGVRIVGDAGDRRRLARRGHGHLRRVRLLIVDVHEADLLHRVEMVEVAPVFLEAVRGRQRLDVVAEMVLAELARVVAEIEQDLGERRRAGPQPARAAGQLRHDQAGAQRVHAGHEGVAPGGAALLGIGVHEPHAFAADAVDVGRLTDHHALVVDPGRHQADVVGHDEQDVGFLASCAIALGGVSAVVEASAASAAPNVLILRSKLIYSSTIPKRSWRIFCCSICPSALRSSCGIRPVAASIIFMRPLRESNWLFSSHSPSKAWRAHTNLRLDF